MSSQIIIYVDIIQVNMQANVNSVTSKIATKPHLSQNPKPLLLIPMILGLILGAKL